MSSSAIISFTLSTTDPAAGLGFEAWVDDKTYVDLEHVVEEQTISIEIPDEDGEHSLRLVLKNKKATDTVIDEAGNIVSDAGLRISDMTFDGIKLGHMLDQLAVYRHDFNGTGKFIDDKFYGEMGCNGLLTVNFTTPIYLWLLENM
jgi:hypothetical protein